MNTLEIYPLPAFEDNYIWCLRRGHALAVVDPGDAAPVLDHLAADGDRLEAILITHHHRDHTGGLPELLARYAVPVFGPAREAIAGITQPVEGGEQIELPGLGLGFAVLDVAGHTRGHVAYYRPGTLFCGDTLFGCGCGRLFEGTAEQMHAALSRLAALPADTQVYCAHEYTASGIRFARAVEPGNAAVEARGREVAALRAARRPTVPFSLADELATNPFLRCGQPAVVAAVRRRLTFVPDGEIEVFAALRRWRDEF